MNTHKILVVLIIGILIASTTGSILGAGVNKSNDSNKMIPKKEEQKISLSTPVFTDAGEYVKINLEEQTSYLMEEGKPMLPVINKVFTFPAGTIIDNTKIIIDWEEMSLTKKIMPSPLAETLSLEPVTFGHERNKIDESVYSNDALYPSEAYTIRTGSGLKNGEHVLYLNARINTQYSPATNLIKVPKNIDICIDYSEPSLPLFMTNTYDLLIITHDIFKDGLQRLVDYKNSIGIKTIMVTVDEIYPNYDGVADWEDIKLYLADVVKQWGIDYVLLAGGRKGQTNEWYVPEFLSNNFDDAYAGNGEPYDMTYASDLYFADVYYYDTYGKPQMDDWDTNNDGLYAAGPLYNNPDYPDYYPDVSLGRIPLRYSWEVDIAVDKIIEYNNNANPSWFKKALFFGGDTSPPARGPVDPGIYEGEIAANLGASYLKSAGFTTTRCFTSDQGDILVTSPDDMTQLFSQGCGWVQMDTHSNPATCGNFQPDAPTEAEFTQFFTIFDSRNLKNNGMYPFLIIDGCHSGQFNVTMQQVIEAGGLNFPRSYFLEWSPTDQCSWPLLQEGGGSIGTIGVSALGYGYINEYITEGLGGWITPRWAHIYAMQDIVYTGDIWTQGIIDYINIIDAINTDEIDRKTIEERVLLGDPSVKLGGSGASLSGPDDDNDKEIPVSFSGIDAPIWEVGDTWTYDIDNLDIKIHETEGRDIDLKLNTEDFTITVIDVNSDTYITEFSTPNANIEADIYFDYYMEDKVPINTSIKLKNVNLKGEIEFVKVNLAIKNVKLDINLDLIENLEGLPIQFNFPPFIEKLLEKISLPADITVDIGFDPAYDIFGFPFETGKTWGTPATTLTLDIDGQISSIWLRLANIFNKIFHFIPDEFAKYLPVIDIGDILEDFGIPSLMIIDMPAMDNLFRKPIFEAYTQKTITVPAGTYDSYQILVIKGLGEMYYAPEVDMFAKLSTPINEFCPIIQNIQMVLKSTNQ